MADNTVAMAAMRRFTPKTARMQALVSARVDWMVAHGVLDSAERISSKSNLWADLGSRGQAKLVVEQAATLGLTTRIVEPPPAWRYLEI